MKHLAPIHTHAHDFWFARGSVLLVVILQLLIINHQFLPGPRWLFPTLESLLLLPLSFATAWTQISVRDARHSKHWDRVALLRRWVRRMALTLTALVTLTNFASLVTLIRVMLAGHSNISGPSLLLDAMNIWATNVIAFSLIYWSTDRGGPASSHLCISDKDDFLFPQETLDQYKDDWTPGFPDYLYLSFTNATAFSPTDTMPLTDRAKMLMMLESAVSLLTLALVAARAVNILS
ncbi:hypothetical protein HMF7854_11605 [Sphingomonas ginkgonis]|uniref:DUF1345 domain-containing protein n=1 Tax=Sphingomonas ginkgonis TaxID=2315330 RepID=A0A429VBT6_9SPHN|nr:hypothetical protein [Sphingomonas ginkgonis]RST31414.1 hypothetical protein HMF7854_11605 [Sphingomonas ginkgonis]